MYMYAQIKLIITFNRHKVHTNTYKESHNLYSETPRHSYETYPVLNIAVAEDHCLSSIRHDPQ